MNLPLSSLLVNRHAPWPSCQITFTRSLRRPRKHEQMTAERVLAQHLLHLECQRRKASAHVRVACRQPHSHARRNRDHRRTRASRTRRSASPSTSPSTRMRCPLPRSISMMPWLFRRRAAAVVNGTSATSRGGADGPISTGTNGAVLALTMLAKLFAPPEQLAHMKAGHASHLGNTGSGLERCCNKPFLLILRPPAPPLDRCDNLCPRNRHSASPRITPRTCSPRVPQTRRPLAEGYLTRSAVARPQATFGKTAQQVHARHPVQRTPRPRRRGRIRARLSVRAGGHRIEAHRCAIPQWTVEGVAEGDSGRFWRARRCDASGKRM